jgi:predicted CXXCH cytochrome family protein
VFGHAPVEDNCTICHDPHGSVASNLLVQNEPFLCLQCHEGHFHMLRQGFEQGVSNINDYSAPGSRVTANMPGGVPGPAADADLVTAANPHGIEGWQKSFGTKCTTCHNVVHGSDFPSQPATARGLTR